MTLGRSNVRSFLRRLCRNPIPAPHSDVLVEENTTLHGCELLGPVQVGFRSYANDSLLRNVVIGRFCSIGRRCSIGAAIHDLSCFTTHTVAVNESFVRDPQTTIGNDVWIGDNVVIVAGVSIGDGAVVGAGAIVTRDVEAYAIMVGIPARLLRMRFEKEVLAALLESQWWKFGDAIISAAGPGASPAAMLRAMDERKFQEFQLCLRAWTPA